MKSCSYCGAEYPDDVVMCAADHTPLSGTPVLSSRLPFKDWSWIRGGARLFCVFLIGITLFLTMLMLMARIDTPEEFLSCLWQDRFNAIPLPFAVFLLILTLPRPKVWTRAAVALVVGFVLWFSVWQWLVHCDYGHWQAHGVHVIRVDDSHLVYEMGGMTEHWDRETMAPHTTPGGIPMLFASVFVLAAVSACLFQILSLRLFRASCKDSDST